MGRLLAVMASAVTVLVSLPVLASCPDASTQALYWSSPGPDATVGPSAPLLVRASGGFSNQSWGADANTGSWPLPDGRVVDVGEGSSTNPGASTSFEVLLDGVLLERESDWPHLAHRFVPPGPLAPGPHVLSVIYPFPDLGPSVFDVPFQVDAGAAPDTGAPEIDVSGFTIADDDDGGLPEPDVPCPFPANTLQSGCFDTRNSHVEIDAEAPGAVVWLLSGADTNEAIWPVSCGKPRVRFENPHEGSCATLTAVRENGLSASTEVCPFATASEATNSGSDGCGQSAPGVTLVWLLPLVWLALRRRDLSAYRPA